MSEKIKFTDDEKDDLIEKYKDSSSKSMYDRVYELIFELQDKRVSERRAYREMDGIEYVLYEHRKWQG